MSRTVRLFISLFILCFVIISPKNCFAFGIGLPDSTSSVEQIRPEHIAINSEDNRDIAKWREINLGSIILRQATGPTFNTFLSDASKHILLELNNNKDYPFTDFKNTHYMSLHFAYMVEDIEVVKQKLLKAGCKVAEEMKTTPSGDIVMMLRDIWDIPIQLVQRKVQMLTFSEFRMEHVALNVEDPVAKAKWFSENLGMKILKQGGAPSYGTFVADKNNNIAFELYTYKEYPMIDFKKLSHMALHFAFMVNDIDKMKNDLIKAGATVVEDITATPSGDKVLMLRDPWGQPIQLVMRKDPMLK